MAVTYLSKGARISDDGLYRYALGRRWAQDGPVATFAGLNPSTADGALDDATIHKCVGFAQRWGCSAMHMLNLYAYRSRHPQALWDGTVEDPVGPKNDEYLLRHMSMAFTNRWPMVMAWGAFPKATDRAAQVTDMFGVWASHLTCLGYTKSEQPQHPLMLAYATELEPFRVPS